MDRTSYKARFIPQQMATGIPSPPFQDIYPVRLYNGSYLELPIQPLPGGEQAIALLMSNQTTFEVEQAITPLLTELARPFEPEMIVGIPTMGLDYARSVAKALRLTQYVALGTSCKFWYDKELSVAVESITSPGQKKFLYIDPALVERVAGKRTLIVDDVVSTGGTMIAAIQLLNKVGVNVAGLVVALTEGSDWKSNLQTLSSDWANRVRSLGHIPLFQRQETGWISIPATEAPQGTEGSLLQN